MIEASAAQWGWEFESDTNPDRYLTEVSHTYLISSGASSIWSSTYDQDQPFKTEKGYWHPAKDSDFPHVIWYKFKRRWTLKKFYFSAIANEYFPRNYILFGSNAADCSDETKWTTLLVRTPENYTGDFVTQEHVDNHQTFKCYGFKFVDSGRDLYTKIQHLKFYANECELLAKPACEKLNGRGMHHNEVCDGPELIHRIFSKEYYRCKCCFPNTNCGVLED